MNTESVIRNINLSILSDIELGGAYSFMYSYMNNEFGNLNMYKHIEKNLFYIGKSKVDIKFIYHVNGTLDMNFKDWCEISTAFHGYGLGLDVRELLIYYMKRYSQLDIKVLFISGMESTHSLKKSLYLWKY